MCKVYLSDSMDFYAEYEEQLILSEHKDIDIERLMPDEIIKRLEDKIFPDILIVDSILPGMRGSDLIKKVKEKSPKTKCIVVTSDEREQSVFSKINVPVLSKPILVSCFTKVFNDVYNSVI